MTPAEVLSKARDVLAERGWHQGGGEAKTGEVCTIRATYLAANRDKNLAWQVESLIAESVSLASAFNVPAWNDDPSRTYEDVILALKQAEELAVERGL